MKKISLYVIVDYIFKFALLFTLNLIWSLYLIRTPWVSILLSVALAVATIVLINYIGNKRNKSKQPKLKEQGFIEDIKNTFIYMHKDDIINFFYKLASQKHQVNKVNNYLEVQGDKKIIIYPSFKMASVTCDEIISIYNEINKENTKKIIILCNKYEPEVLNCLNNFECKIILLDYKQTYFQLLKEYEFYPKVTIKKKQKTKSTFTQLLMIAFNKKKTKTYLVSALFMLFASYFVVYKIYYLIFASILLIFAILCQFDYKFNRQVKDELLN